MQWNQTGEIIYYTDEAGNLFSIDIKNDKKDSFNLLQQINQLWTYQGLPNLKSLPKISISNGIYTFVDKGIKYETDGKNSFKKLYTIPANSENIDIANNNNIAYTKGHQLWITKPNGDSILIATGSEGIVYGQSVHRNEFGIHKGTFWSPKGNKLAFYRMDQSMVTEYPIINWIEKPAKSSTIFYPMAGDSSHQVTVGIFDLNTGKTIYLQSGGDPEHYLTNISWFPDESQIYIAEVNRDQNQCDHNIYDVYTGKKINTIIKESNQKYIEPTHPLEFIPGNDNQFILSSNRDGWMKLYLYKTDGTLLRELSPNVEVEEIIGFDKAVKHLYFSAFHENSIDKLVYRTELLNGQCKIIADEPGQNDIILDPKNNNYITINKSQNTAGKYTYYDSKKNKSKVFKSINDPLDEYNIGRIVIDTLHTTDGTPLFTRTIYPFDFDPNKKYPAIIYVYGGPHAQLIRNDRLASASSWMPCLANEGFIVFTLDNRGSGNRGLNFEQSTFRQLGEIEINDQMLGYHYIASLPYVDKDHIGVHGWSYGGFMTVRLATQKEKYFYAAVAGGPVIDWSMYEVMYTERYMDTPQNNQEGYAQSNTLNYIDQIKSPLLLIHGTSDDVVVWQHTIKYLKGAIEKGKQIDYFVYPGHKHNVTGKDRVHLIQKIIDYFKQNI